MLAAALVAGCAGGVSPVPRTTLLVFAAASLEPALGAIKAAYGRSHTGVDVTVSADASSALAVKLEQGAPADVYLSADTADAQKLVDAGLADGAVVAFAANRLALIVPAANPGAIRTPADLARPGLRIAAAAEAVPITRYAEGLVANLGALPGYPSGYAAAYASNVVSREDNVAAVVAKVALGEADAGIVYATDAKSSADVVAIPIPDEANVRAVYGGVALRAGPNLADAREFLRWLVGPDGRRVLADLGFLAP